MLEIGSLVDGKYKILSKIGHGGMSVVYMAINEKANKTWAIKEVRKDGRMDFNTVRQGLLAEIDTLKRLKHPNLPSIVDVIEDEDSFIIVMDYIEGRSLDKIIEENGAQPESFVVEWAKQLCDVFGYLHSREPAIIYRDMKPANVMLKPDGSIMVIDFGTAKNYEIELGETTGIGTIGYAAPEQYIGSGLGRTDARTDIYCLGITLYHLLTNIDPCKNLISDKSIRAVNPTLSHGLDAIIQKCTQHQPADRYQSCAELMYDLEHYKDLEPLHRKKQKRKLASFISVIACSLVFIILGIVFNVIASSKATDTYETKLYEASIATDYDEKIELYTDCIAIPNKSGEKDAYLGLIKTFKEDDQLFTKGESDLIKSLIKNNKSKLQEDSASYSEICFELGKLYWYYSDYGERNTRAIQSVIWFEDVLRTAPDSFENIGMAKTYASIGAFYRDIGTNIEEGTTKDGQYKELFTNLNTLVNEVAANEDEHDIVRLELIEFARNTIHVYTGNFKKDKVNKEDVLELCSKIEELVNSVDAIAEKTEMLKNETLKNLPDTINNIELVYGTDKGGNK